MVPNVYVLKSSSRTPIHPVSLRRPVGAGTPLRGGDYGTEMWTVLDYSVTFHGTP